MAAAAPDPYGRSLALDDGDLVLDTGADGIVRARESSGEPNLLQSLALRVLTPLGSDQFNVTYGLDAHQIFTEPGGVRMTKDLIRLNLVRTLGTDRRVRDVREILFMDDPEYRERHGVGDEEARQARTGRLWTVDVVLELVPEGETTLSVTVGA